MTNIGTKMKKKKNTATNVTMYEFSCKHLSNPEKSCREPISLGGFSNKLSMAIQIS